MLGIDIRPGDLLVSREDSEQPDRHILIISVKLCCREASQFLYEEIVFIYIENTPEVKTGYLPAHFPLNYDVFRCF